MPFSEILVKAIKYPWKNRALWIMGLLFAFVSTVVNITNYVDGEDVDKIANSVGPSGQVILSLVLVVSVFLTLFMSIWFQIGLTQGALTANQNKKVKIKASLKMNKGAFWNLVLLEVLIPLALLLVVASIFVLGAMGFAALPNPYGSVVGIIVAILVILALIPVIVYVGLIWNLAIRFVIADSKKAIEAIKLGRNLLKGSGWLTLGFTVIIGMISGSANFFSLIPFFIAFMATIFFISEAILVGSIISGLFAFVFLVIALVISGYFEATSQIGYTLWWQELKKLKKNK